MITNIQTKEPNDGHVFYFGFTIGRTAFNNVQKLYWL